MYIQNDIVAAAKQIIVLDPPRIDPAARRAEIDKVIELATAAIPKPQMRKLGRLSLAPARDDDDHSYFAQIRSEPIGASGLEFRFPMPARDTGGKDLTSTVADLVDAAVRVAKNASRLKNFVRIVREIAIEALRPANGGIAEMRLVAIGITPVRSDEHVKVTVDVEMLGDDLTMNVERASGYVALSGLDGLEDKLRKYAAKHVARRALLAQAKVAGISGWIDDSALRILNVSGFDRATALGMLRADRQVNFSFGRETGYELMAGVHWDDGVVRGYVEKRGPGSTFRLEAEVLTIEAGQLPATIMASLLGRSLGEVLEIDFVPANALIVGVKDSGGWLYLSLEIGRSTIEDAVEG